MIRREAIFNRKFHSWIRSYKWMTSPYELKQTTKNFISFSCVAEHQLNALLACKSDKGFFYKISDQSQGIKPFDGFYFRNSPAWIVIRFPKGFEIIDVTTFVMEKERSKQKSLTAKRAKELSTVSICLR